MQCLKITAYKTYRGPQIIMMTLEVQHPMQERRMTEIMTEEIQKVCQKTQSFCVWQGAQYLLGAVQGHQRQSQEHVERSVWILHSSRDCRAECKMSNIGAKDAWRPVRSHFGSRRFLSSVLPFSWRGDLMREPSLATS